MGYLEEYYNKFNEDKRLQSRHGQVEFRVSMEYIQRVLSLIKCNLSDIKAMDESLGLHNVNNQIESQNGLHNVGGDEIAINNSNIKILDIGAATGAYTIPLAKEGYDVTAVEPVKHNHGRLRQKIEKEGLESNARAILGNALKLKKLDDNSFDLTLMFGPMYHLFGHDQKLIALEEAKRVTRPGGIIMNAYVMNEYSVITYAFKEMNILECLEQGRFTEDFHTISKEENLYDYVRIEDIDALNKAAGLERMLILSPDGAADYIRPYLNKLTDEQFDRFVEYQLSICERADLIGAGAHTLDILRNTK